MGGNQVKVKEIELQKEIEIEKMRIRSGEEERDRKIKLENEERKEERRQRQRKEQIEDQQRAWKRELDKMKYEMGKLKLDNERLEETNRHKEEMLEKRGKIVKDIWKEHIDAQVKEGFTNEIAVKNTERVLAMVCEQINIEEIEEEDLKKE